MLIINVKKAGSIDKAIKQLSKKFKDTKVVQQLRERKEYMKPSAKKREIYKKACRKNLLNREDNQFVFIGSCIENKIYTLT